MKKKLIAAAAGVIISVLLPGCLFESYHRTSNYDLNPVPPTCPESADIQVNEFQDLSGAGCKMRYRSDNYSIYEDGYNKWVQPPAGMLARFLKTAFCHPGDAGEPRKVYILSGTIEAFEINLDNKSATIQLTFTLSKPGSRNPLIIRTIREKEQFPEASPEKFAAAMTIAADRIAAAIRKEIHELEAANNRP